MASLKVLVSLGESESFWWVGGCIEEEPDGVRFLVGVVGGLGERGFGSRSRKYAIMRLIYDRFRTLP